jgi:HD-GYP domain-containing protein (c-di-GMP phosphodiesterase class II)
VLSRIQGFDEMNEWASFHHEKLDGSGYPFHHDECNLSLGSRIMGVADIYVALAEDRPYRAGMKKKEIVDIMSIMAQENKLEKNVVKILFDNMEEIDNLRSIAQSISESDYSDLSLGEK